eukprot:CAMPEP_0182850932 /NCGR_PEP_ID=MMETSP0006_2-20121128/30360_1 /TAXON_ID=97485 /ORGANISM="Prymnesium parvum, Strain Texoma1" /LENGTH=55 /DNA_ID=CAMNT_0024981575 /DNA_START=842 /DNA_END=1009 /DNA_ORIENTATION=-
MAPRKAASNVRDVCAAPLAIATAASAGIGGWQYRWYERRHWVSQKASTNTAPTRP